MLLAEVVVDRPVWGLDRPLDYLVPEPLQEVLRLGAIVRVPLRGRRARGWVVGTRTVMDAPEGALPVAKVSSPLPVFDSALLEVARAMARRYIHPLSSFLRLFTPPLLARSKSAGLPTPAHGRDRPPPPVLWRPAPGTDPVGRYAEMIAAARDRGAGAIVVVPEVREGSRVLESLFEKFEADAALVHAGVGDAARAEALWSVAAGSKSVVLGSRAAVFAPAFSLGAIVVHQEHDRSLKEQRAPYYHAVEVALARAAATGSSVLLAGSPPSLSSLRRAEGAWSIEEPSRVQERRRWPVVEVVHPVRSAMAPRAIAAILEARRRAERALVLLPRVRATPSGPGPGELVRYLVRVVPSARVTRAEGPGGLKEVLEGDVIVATEAALADVGWPSLGCAVALGIDSYLRRPEGLGPEHAFATLWTLASLLASSADNDERGRLLLETAQPGHHVVQALTRGDYHYFARRELEARRVSESPPFRALIKVRITGNTPGAMEQLRSLPGTVVLGPVEGRLGEEALLKVEVLEEVLDPLRRIVSMNAPHVSVEVDPRSW